MDSQSSALRRNIQFVARIARHIVTERFKRMAKDEVLSKFIQSHVDPILLVDINLQIDREAIDLAEMSLLTLVTGDRMSNELKRSAARIQKAYQDVYGEESDVVRDFSSPELTYLRIDCFRARIELYKVLLIVQDEVGSAYELAVKAFKKAERFQSRIEALLLADKRYNEELVRSTEATHRFLMKKQTEYEISKSEELWLEFKSDSFKETQALP